MSNSILSLLSSADTTDFEAAFLARGGTTPKAPSAVPGTRDPLKARSAARQRYWDQQENPTTLPVLDLNCQDCGATIPYAQKACAQCGRVKPEIELEERACVNSGAVRISTGRNKGRHYSISGDYSSAQRRALMLELTCLNTAAKGTQKMPTQVIYRTVQLYNQIQRDAKITEYDMEGKLVSKRIYVCRRNSKLELLASILYAVCIASGLARKPKDIADFVGLQTGGYARGDNKLRKLVHEGVVDLELDKETSTVFAVRYLEMLEINKPELLDFVVDLVETSERVFMCMDSLISSKVAGAIWLAVKRAGLAVTVEQLERATDNTKKNTFSKFEYAVYSRPDIFDSVFKRHGVSRVRIDPSYLARAVQRYIAGAPSTGRYPAGAPTTNRSAGNPPAAVRAK